MTDEERFLREIALKVAWSHINTPYIWGGDDPDGMDCSGFVIEVMKSIGKLPRYGDWTAHNLFLRFLRVGCPVTVQQTAGNLVFFQHKTEDRMVHVEIVLGDGLSIGASGGGSRTTDRATAMESGAYIKVRPWKNDDRATILVNPFAC